ncbi:MAG: energy transducer TonB [Candidatus Scalindua sp.]|jgi:TonB family protein|nr:energy transducer TonB [Cytophagia bacterium]MBT6052913.1 energy transducer TonB [Candidatus Scalindua sp.]MBT6226054.1 energy transducer TonB [Candidatus Scalindua sp.]
MKKVYYIKGILLLILYLLGCKTNDGALETNISSESTNEGVSTTVTSSHQSPFSLEKTVLIGEWAVYNSDRIKYIFREDHTFTVIVRERDDYKPRMNGHWELLENRQVRFVTKNRPEYIAELHGDNLLVYKLFPNMTIYRKLDEVGKPLPIEHNSIMQFPLFDTSKIIGFHINEYYNNYTDLLAVNAEYQIVKENNEFTGEVKFNESSQHNDTTIFVPKQNVQIFLKVLSQTPLINEIYQPLINHEHDYPENEIGLLFEDTVIKFYSNSQGQIHIPWRVTIDSKEYITYSENVMQAIVYIRSFMVHNNQKEVHEKAVSFDDWDSPGLPNHPQTRVKFIHYDEAPEPIEGYVAMQRSVIYPDFAMKAGIEGTVIVQTFIDEKGNVGETIIDKGMPNTGMNEAAVATIKRTQWKPAKQNGNNIGTWILIPIYFEIATE